MPDVSETKPRVLPEDEEEAERSFNNLPVQQQLEFVLRYHGNERLRHLFLSHQPKELVQRLPEIELFLMVKRSEERDAFELVSLTTPEQFQFLLDLDFWDKDQLDLGKATQWMGVLLECGEEKVQEFIQSTDPEFIALLLKKFLHVIKLEGEPAEVSALALLFTLDRQYYVAFKKPEARPIFQRFLEYLRYGDEELYARLMEAVIVEFESELEELNYGHRNGRLSDHGFPGFEEALDLYRFVHPESLRSEKISVRVEQTKATEKANPIFYLTLREEGPFFSHILSQITDSLELDRLQSEMAALCNRAMVAEPLEAFSPDEIERVTKKVFHYLTLGLEFVSRRDEAKAIELLQSIPLTKIFQGGLGTTLLLRQKAEAILRGPWFGGERENLVFLDPLHLERFEGVLRKRPVHFRSGVPDDFKNLLEVEETERFLRMVETVSNTLVDKVGLSTRHIKELNLTDCHPSDWHEISFSTLFLTALANLILRGSFHVEPIESENLEQLFIRIFEKNDQGQEVIRMQIRSDLTHWLKTNETDEQRHQDLLAFWDFCFDLLEGEYGRIPQKEKIDPRFVKGLIIRK